ncbi:hypothetical protein R50072_33470 [Simiduia litorea]|uniref:hypothetical protein n=1 Tax=Simiduia litorea TaxID=1435348 RepID=UPI0036F2FC4F
MNINDEKLSAFLDAELPEAEMSAIRERIADDESLANRLAELAAVDSQLQACYQRIDEQPMPTAITDMIAASAKQQSEQEKPAPKTSAKIFHFPQFAPQHLAMAASVALAIGIAMNHWLTPGLSADTNWQELAQALDTLPSGETLQLNTGGELTTKVSFTNSDGQWCRQYQASSQTDVTQGIACRNHQSWQSVAVLTLANTETTNGQQYQTASNDKAIVELVDKMAVGNFLNRSQEAKAIAEGWINNNQTQHQTTEK